MPPATKEKVNQVYLEDRPANFVFLIDVSGSMVLPRTMVQGAGGKQITLFEALRAALKQIAQDPRILSANSKVAFVTFGTEINEKSDWPNSVKQAGERAVLLEKISSPQELLADKHGDTYMAGALDEAYKKAVTFTKESPECTTTFILMFTDGWDEPPKGAPLEIRSTAARIVEKEKQLKQKLGVNTWQVRVIGLQRLPDKKAGTTTAAEVAEILGGQFLDVTKAKGGTVAEQIYTSLKKTIEELQGQIDIPAAESDEGVVNFGKIVSEPRASATVIMSNKSCYVEKITGVQEVSKKLSASEIVAFKRLVAQNPRLKGGVDSSGLKSVSSLAGGAINIVLRGAPEFLLAPVNQLEPALVDSSSNYNKVDLQAVIGPGCPPGTYLGALAFKSTAKVPGKMPYVLSVPSRYFVEPEPATVSFKKKGFLFNESGETELTFSVGARVNSSYAMDFKFDLEPQKAAKIRKSKSVVELPASLINSGKTVCVSVNSAAAGATPVRLPIEIPANTEPGIYEGTVKVHCQNTTEVAGPAELKYKLTIYPSPWDEMGPIAIPVLAVLAIVLFIGVVMAIAGSRERM